MTITLTGDWSKVQDALTNTTQKLRDASRRALLQEGQSLRTKIFAGIRDQAPGGKTLQPLSPLTLAARKHAGFSGTKALITRQASLLGSVTVKEQGEAVFVGVLRNAVDAAGKQVANVAEIQEFGAGPIIIRMTEKMRRYLFALMREAGVEPRSSSGNSTGYVVIRIPPRPFIGPVWESEGTPPEKVAARFAARLQKELGGAFGTSGGVP